MDLCRRFITLTCRSRGDSAESLFCRLTPNHSIMRQMRQLSFYTRSQRSVASILLTVWLLASCNPNIVLAAPERERAIVPATTTIPPALTLPVDRGPGIDTALVPLSHRAASLLPRKIDRPASRFSRARLQEALSLQAGPVAEAVEESSSSGQHPAIAAPMASSGCRLV